MAKPKFNIADLISQLQGGGGGGAPLDMGGGMPPPDLGGMAGVPPPPALPGGGALPIGGPAIGAPMGAGALPPIPAARPKKKHSGQKKGK